MRNKDISKETKEKISLFARQSEREWEIPSRKITEMNILGNELTEKWFNHPDYDDGKHIIVFSMKNMQNGAVEDGVLLSWVNDKGNRTYFFRYEDSGRFSPMIHCEENKKHTFAEAMLLILNKVSDGFLLKRDSFDEKWTVDEVRVHRKEKTGWKEIFLAGI